MESKALVQRKAKSISLRLAISIAVFLVTLLLFLSITHEVVVEKETHFDEWVFKESVLPIITPRLTTFMLYVTFFGSHKFLIPAYLILTSYYLFRKKRNSRLSFNIISIGLTSTGLLFFLKSLFKRKRPLEPLVSAVKGFSYPSGHSFSSFTFFGILIYIAWQSKLSNAWKWLFSVCFSLIAFLIAFSRVYLRVHFASDVIAGFCLSMVWLGFCFWLFDKLSKKKLAENN